MGYDPAKLAKKQDKGNTRMELPADAYVSDTQKSMFALRGNKLNTEGKPAIVDVNQYRMVNFNFKKTIYQYDVSISPDMEKSVVLKKIWAHDTTKKALAKYNYPMWIFDGKLAWSAVLLDRGEIRFMVDLDENKRPPGAPVRESARFYLKIRKTTEVNVAAIHGYLERRMLFNTTVQEGLNFIDHLIRQFPSQNMLSIKRNFYDEREKGRPLMGAGPQTVEVHKGVYASVRLSHNLARGGIGLALNTDIANICFWVGNQTMENVMCLFLETCDKRWAGLTPITVAKKLRPVKHHSGTWASSDAFKQLRKLRRLKFKVRHANRPDKERVYTIVDFAFQSTAQREAPPNK